MKKETKSLLLKEVEKLKVQTGFPVLEILVKTIKKSASSDLQPLLEVIKEIVSRTASVENYTAESGKIFRVKHSPIHQTLKHLEKFFTDIISGKYSTDPNRILECIRIFFEINLLLADILNFDLDYYGQDPNFYLDREYDGGGAFLKHSFSTSLEQQMWIHFGIKNDIYEIHWDLPEDLEEEDITEEYEELIDRVKKFNDKKYTFRRGT